MCYHKPFPYKITKNYDYGGFSDLKIFTNVINKYLNYEYVI